MLGWVGDVERATLDNETFRTVLFTGEHTQLTVMRLAPGEDIGREAHDHNDQFIRIELGSARIELDGGGIAVYSRAHTTSVYVAYPDSAQQVEVYDPSPAKARQLVQQGLIRPVR